MAKRNTSESDSESDSDSGEEQTIRNGNRVSKYEEQRLQRIAENRVRLDAMGLPQMASSLKLKKGSSRIKKEVKDEDEEYIPEDEGEGEPGSSSSSEQDERDFDLDLEKASGSRKKKVKNKSVKMKGRVYGKKQESSEYTGGGSDDDEALRQAIALSLQDTAEASYCCDKNVENTSKDEKKRNIHVQEAKGRKKIKKSFTSRLQMTEDEFIVHFFQLDEAGKGTVTKRDLERAALAHDFVWTDEELVDMIRCFDGDGDEKLSLDDFRKIVVRCNMIKD